MCGSLLGTGNQNEVLLGQLDSLMGTAFSNSFLDRLSRFL